MTSLPFSFYVIAAILLATLFAIASYLYERRRTEALRAAAAALDLAFEPEDVLSESVRGLGFELLERGGSGIRNVMSGDLGGAALRVFGYSYTTGSGKNRRTHRQSVALFTSDGLDLPAFRLRPEHLGDRIGALFGYTDIDFDAHPAFSRAYKLQGEDEAAIRARFDDGVIGFLEAHPKLAVEGRPGALLVYRPGRRVSPADVEAFARQAIELAGLFLKGAARASP